MIITVTPNAALDKTIQVPSMQLGMRHRGAQGLVAPGGKGDAYRFEYQVPECRGK